MATTTLDAAPEDEARHVGVPVPSGRPARWRAPALVALAQVLIAIPYAARGANFILDDWWSLRNATFDGAWAAAGADQQLARPGAWLVYAVTFGGIGRHPLAIYLVQVAVNVAAAVLLLLLVRRFTDRWVALLVALLWVAVPNHVSLLVWASALNITVALVLLLAGAVLVAHDDRDPRRVAVAVLCWAVAVLCYEATMPAAALAPVLLPLLGGGRPRLATVAATWATLAAVAAWIVAHWHPAKHDQGWASAGDVLPAHLGWGVLPDGPVFRVVSLAATVAMAVTIGRVVLRRHTVEPTAWLVPIGALLVVVGLLPFLRYFYAPLGAGDRVNVVSSLGTALVWAGILISGRRLLARHLGTGLSLAAAGVLGFTFAAVAADRQASFARAGSDVLRTLDALDAVVPDPDGPIVIGPVPLQEDNVAGLLDSSIVSAALQTHRGTRAVAGSVTLSAEDFWRAPADHRFDHRVLRP